MSEQSETATVDVVLIKITKQIYVKLIFVQRSVTFNYGIH